jgi:cystathionine beta-lyase/cystathionine gamma-synthase
MPSHRAFDHVATAAIHAGRIPDTQSGSIVTPICQSTTFRQARVGAEAPHTYSRASNPTVSSLESALAAFENAAFASCYATGLAAETTLFLATLSAGNHVICSDVVYGGTVRLLRNVLRRLGIDATFTDASDPDNVRRAITPHTRLIFIETPANPTLKLTDIAAVAAIARDHNLLLAVDNTFLTAALQRPIDLGATLSLYSTTKYIDGHNATVGGAIVTNDRTLHEKLIETRKTLGCIQSPLNAWLTLQGLKTLPLRIHQQSASALHVAHWLARHPAVRNVRYPFLPDAPSVDLARRQQLAGGGIIAFEVVGGAESGVSLMNAVRLCTLAENLGSIETLITHPASMTHASMTHDEREALGITDGLIRLSIGLEHPDDIIDDLSDSLAIAAPREVLT